MSDKIVVCGAGGYVGSHLVEYFLSKGFTNIRALAYRKVDDWLRIFPKEVECISCDLRDEKTCERETRDASIIINLAARVGGLGFITKHKATCMLSALINMNLLRASVGKGIAGYFFASSSCVYPNSDSPLMESDACLGSAMAGYGEEKRFSEQFCLAMAEEKNIPVRIARFHTVYGPGDIRPEGCDHVTTALCKKVIEAKISGRHEINIWGNGDQTRSFLYIDDCVEGIHRILQSGVQGPTNLANSEIVSVNGLVDMLEEIAAVKLHRFYSPTAPQGRVHKTSDNTMLRNRLNWEPTTPIKVGLERLYRDLWDRAILKK